MSQHNTKQRLGNYPFPSSGEVKLTTNQTTTQEQQHVVTTIKPLTNIRDKTYFKEMPKRYLIQLWKHEFELHCVPFWVQDTFSAPRTLRIHLGKHNPVTNDVTKNEALTSTKIREFTF